MHCDKLLFYICLSKKKPYRAYVVMLLYSTVNKSSMSMSMSTCIIVLSLRRSALLTIFSEGPLPKPPPPPFQTLSGTYIPLSYMKQPGREKQKNALYLRIVQWDCLKDRHFSFHLDDRHSRNTKINDVTWVKPSFRIRTLIQQVEILKNI